jgi:hypothetical protein
MTGRRNKNECKGSSSLLITYSSVDRNKIPGNKIIIQGKCQDVFRSPGMFLAGV